MFYGRKAVIMPNATACEGRYLYMCRLTHTYTQACATVCIDQCVCTQKDFDVFKKAREVFGKAREVFGKHQHLFM